MFVLLTTQLYFQFLRDHWSSFAKIIYIPQTASKDVKDEMKIKLHMDGDVNGCKFKIEMDKEGLTSKYKKLNHWKHASDLIASN